MGVMLGPVAPWWYEDTLELLATEEVRCGDSCPPIDGPNIDTLGPPRPNIC